MTGKRGVLSGFDGIPTGDFIHLLGVISCGPVGRYGLATVISGIA